MNTKWIDTVKTGILKIDQEHHDLYDILIKIYLAIEHKKKYTFSDPLLVQLIEMMMIHFHTEEKYFEQYEYPKADEHIQEHIKIRTTIARFFDTYYHGNAKLTKESLHTLATLFLNHIEEFDMEYVPYIKLNIRKDMAHAV